MNESNPDNSKLPTPRFASPELNDAYGEAVQFSDPSESSGTAPQRNSQSEVVASGMAEVAPSTGEVPGFVNGEYYSLDPKNITVDMTSQLITATVLSIGALVGLGFAWFGLGFEWVFWLLVALVVLASAALFATAFFWPKIDYRHTSFRIDPLGVEIRRGVFWRHQICVPIGRVQHADVSQGPIQRINGVASLTLHTAGTSNASVELDGLDHQFAIDFRDWIVHQRKDQDAV